MQVSACILQRLRPTIPLSLVLLPPYFHYYAQRRVGAAGSAYASSREQHRLMSPDLVALEYADLNLTHKVSHVILIIIII